jgi:hypothetical protein
LGRRNPAQFFCARHKLNICVCGKPKSVCEGPDAGVLPIQAGFGSAVCIMITPEFAATLAAVNPDLLQELTDA